MQDYITTPGTSGWGPVSDGAIYAKNLERQAAANRFLDTFSKLQDKSNKYTDMATGANKSSGININVGDSDNKLAPGVSELAPDIFLQQGYTSGDWTMPGTEGRKGILGDTARALGSNFGGTWGSVAGNVAGGYLDYV